MKNSSTIQKALENERNRTSKEDQLLSEAKKVLIQSRLTEKNILDNLKFYKTSYEFLDEESGLENIFTLQQIKTTCKKLRLRFLPSQIFEGDIPYEAVLKIKQLNSKFGKELKHFKILSTKKFFSETDSEEQAILFAQTLYGNYYPVHSWGKSLEKNRMIRSFPLRNFESLAFCILAFTLIECLLIPNKYLTTDWRATYFSMYRIAAFFHMLILNAGLLVFLLFAFHCNFSENVWDDKVKRRDTKNS